MINPNLCDKYKKMELKTDGTLFGIDWKTLKETKTCPWGHKLYPMLNKPYLYCKSKKHKSFVIKK